MLSIFLASMIAFNTLTNDFTQGSKEFSLPIESGSHSVQEPRECQAFIEKIYQYATQIDAGNYKYLGASLAAKDLLPGTLIFSGTSEENIDTLVLCLDEGQCYQVASQNGKPELSLCALTDLDLSQSPYHALYSAAADVSLVNKSYDYSNLIPAPASFLDEKFNSYFVNEQHLPLVLSPKNNEITLADVQVWAEAHQNELHSLLASQGALLWRGFPVDGAEDFATVVKAVIGQELNDYKGEGSRNRLAQGVYTSTKAPLKFKIPLHNELTCTTNPVDYICFYCDIAPESGAGQTILARTEDVTLEMMKRPHVWDLFNGKMIKYISRHPPEGNFFARINPTHRTWQQVFETDDKDEVETICAQKGYDFKWKGDWLEITRHAPAICGPDQYFDHPYWFNQAHLYHSNARIYGGWVNYLLAKLLYISPSTRAYDVEFEDGSTIPRKIVYEIYDVLDEKTIKFNWEENDVLLLDNRRTLHGRAPCVGPRRILTAMVQ